VTRGGVARGLALGLSSPAMTRTRLCNACVLVLALGAAGCNTYDHDAHPDDGAADAVSPVDARDASASDGALDARAQDGGGEDASGMDAVAADADADASVAEAGGADAADVADAADAGHADATDVVGDGAMSTNQIRNGGFESTGSMWLAPWYFQYRNDGMGDVAQDATGPEAGMYSLRVDVTQAGSASWYVQLAQGGLSIQSGVLYTIAFWIRADHDRMIDIGVQDDGAPYATYFGTAVAATTAWRQFTATFTASATARVMLAVNLGSAAGQVWLDEASLSP
jgi:hypothetical protein